MSCSDGTNSDPVVTAVAAPGVDLNKVGRVFRMVISSEFRIVYVFTLASGTNITKMSPTSLSSDEYVHCIGRTRRAGNTEIM